MSSVFSQLSGRPRLIWTAVGVYGNSNRDEFLWTRNVTHTDGTLKIEFFDGSNKSLQVPEKPSKLTLERIPTEFRLNVAMSRVGGGVVNSRIAVELIGMEIGETNEIRLLDANKLDSLVGSATPSPVRYLNLRTCPRNYVLGNRDDKWIFRSPIERAAPLVPPQYEEINWLFGAETILINGAKDVEPVEIIVSERDRRGFELILMLTPSLPAAFLKRILPAADIVIGAWDELQFLTGDSAVTVEGAALTAERLRRLTEAELHVTMGKHGDLSMGAGSREPVHIKLNEQSELGAQTQALVRGRPARVCGAGDAFAAGVLVRRAFGWSLLSGGGGFGSHVGNALAGCASALRWIGVSSGLAVDAFGVRFVPCVVAA